MSDKIQRNSAMLKENMLRRYDDGLQHKHDKNHNPYRLHQRTHPCLNPNYLHQLENENKEPETNKLRSAYKLRRIRKRYTGGFIH